MGGKRGTFAFNFGKQGQETGELVGLNEKDLIELKPGEILKTGDYRRSQANGWVVVESFLVGTEVPKPPRASFLKKRRGIIGYYRSK